MNAVWISNDLTEYIKCKNIISCRVHSTFKHAINLLDDSEEIISLLPSHKGIAPMSVIVSWSNTEINKLFKDDVAQISHDQIFFPRTNAHIDLRKAQSAGCEIDSDALKWSKQVVSKNIELLKESLLKNGDDSGLLPLISEVSNDDGIKLPKNQYCIFIQDIFHEILFHVENENYEEFIACMPKFIGFGPGLTPSTDDFIAGIILTQYYIHAIKNKSKLNCYSTLYDSIIGRTTKISEVMLKRAVEGKAARLYHDVIKSMFYENNLAFVDNIMSVIETGATSGTDFLLGVYCMLNIESNKKGDTGYGNV